MYCASEIPISRLTNMRGMSHQRTRQLEWHRQLANVQPQLPVCVTSNSMETNKLLNRSTMRERRLKSRHRDRPKPLIAYRKVSRNTPAVKVNWFSRWNTVKMKLEKQESSILRRHYLMLLWKLTTRSISQSRLVPVQWPPCTSRHRWVANGVCTQMEFKC